MDILNADGKPSLRCIKNISRSHYASDIPLDHVPSKIRSFMDEEEGYAALDMDPDFQRGYVWTTKQQREYVEWLLKDGESGRNLYFNHPNWMGSFSKGPFVLVDGKQRINAIIEFIENRLKVFGGFYWKDFLEDHIPMTQSVRFCINTLKTREEVLQWYLDMNSCGTHHTDDDLGKVKRLLKEERRRNE